MKQRLLTFNDIEEVTKTIVNNDLEGLFHFCSKYDNVIDILKVYKNTLFENKVTTSIYVSTEDFKGDIVADRPNILYNFPNYEYKNVIVDNINFKLTYPKVLYQDFDKNKFTCIREINGNKVTSDDIQALISSIPISFYKKIIKKIDDNIISDINNIFLLHTKNEKYCKKFNFSLDGILNLFLILCKYDTEYLMKLKLILIKEGNFALQDFSTITIEQSNTYYKLLKELYRDESDS